VVDPNLAGFKVHLPDFDAAELGYPYAVVEE